MLQSCHVKNVTCKREMMGISIKRLESLVDSVVLPFEKFIMDDPRLERYLADPEVAKIHNMAVSKLTVYIYSDIKRAYAYIQQGAKAHREKQIPVENLKEFYTLYFALCKEWNTLHREVDDRFGENLATIEQFVYESFSKEGESKEDFYIYDSEVIHQDMAKMHYKDEQKISAEAFCAEGSIDAFDIQDILEACQDLFDAVQEGRSEYDEAYFLGVNVNLRAYAIILEKNSEFRDLGFSLAKLSDFLEAHLAELPTHVKKGAVLVILKAIVEDLIAWTKGVLEEKTAVDIHYLDASLLSSIIQFEMMFAPAQNDEDDLEFF